MRLIQRLVGVGVFADQLAGAGVEDEQLVLAAARLAEEDRDGRLRALELRRDLVDRRAGSTLGGAGHGARDRLLPGGIGRPGRHRAGQVPSRFAQRFLFAEKFRRGDDETGGGRKEEEESRWEADPAVPSPPPCRVHAAISYFETEGLTRLLTRRQQ
jgi:hypothetical protein